MKTLALNSAEWDKQGIARMGAGATLALSLWRGQSTVLKARVGSEGRIILLLVLIYKDTRPCWLCKWPLSISVAFSESCERPKVTLPPARASHPFSQMCLDEWVCLDVP